MSPILQYKKILDKAKNPQLNQDGLIDLYSAERVAIYPGERIFIRTFLDIHISDQYFGILLSNKDLYYRYGIQVYNDIISGEKNDLQLLLTNVNIPKGILMSSDKEKLFGERTKYDIFIGDKIGHMLILPKVNFNQII